MQTNIFKTQDEQITNLINELHILILKLLKKKDSIVIAVSGGRSPINLFTRLSKLNLPWEKITITLVDERIVSVDSEDSNENLIKTYLLQNCASVAKFVGLVDINKPLTDMLNYANNLSLSIDIALLGMGEDGHTASIFPDCLELGEAIAKGNLSQYLVTNPRSAKYPRISLTLNAIINIPSLFLVINGENKLKVYNEALKGDNMNYPISYVFSRRTDLITYWFE